MKKKVIVLINTMEDKIAQDINIINSSLNLDNTDVINIKYINDKLNESYKYGGLSKKDIKNVIRIFNILTKKYE